MKFISPCFQAYFEVVSEDLDADIHKYGIAAVSWAIKVGACHGTQPEREILVWNGPEQV